MLITFSCSAYPDITMFGNVALTLLKMMGLGAVGSGAISANEVPVVLEHLRNNISAGNAKKEIIDTSIPDDNEDSSAGPISISQRAFPLLELLEIAKMKGCNVTWQMTD